MGIHLKYLIAYFCVFFLITNANSQDTLRTEEVDISNCIPYSPTGKRVITSRAEVDAFIQDVRREHGCVKLLKKIDMSVYSLIGLNLETDWCGKPKGLEVITTRIDAEQKYILTINYRSPVGLCRGLIPHDLWVKVPALIDGYQVEFVIKERGTEQEE